MMAIPPTSAIAKVTLPAAAAGVARGVTEQQRQQPTDENGGAREISKPRFGKQVDRARPQVRRDEERADQVPGAVKGLAPAKRATPELGAGADPVPQESDRPHELKAVAALPPLVEDQRGEDKAQHRRTQRQHHVEDAHDHPSFESDSTIATRTSLRNQPTLCSRSPRAMRAALISFTLERTMPSNRWKARIASPTESRAS